MKKRFIALLLCCVMLFTLSPSLISAASATDINGTTVETPTDEPTAEPTVEEPKTEEPKTEEPKTEEPKTEEPKTEEPKAEEPKAVEPKAEEETTIPAAEQSDALVESEIITPTVNFTDVAPFLDPVSGGVRMLRAAPLAARAAANFATNDAANDTATDNGMKISKTATANKDGSYTITLEAYATGSKVISEVKEDVPTDIVLVLDQSGSMDYCIVCGKEMDGYNDYHYTYVATTSIDTNNTYYIKNGNEYTRVQYCSGTHRGIFSESKCEGGAGWYTSIWSDDHTTANKITPKTSDNPEGTQFYEYKWEACSSRLQALKTAVTSFADSVAEKAKGADGTFGTDDDVNHRIAVVGFASQSGYGNNTELLSIAGKNSGSVGVAYDSITNQNLKDVLQSMDTQNGRDMVNAAITALTANGATRTDLGMDMAQRILNANPVSAGETRNRVVIVFTDGAPTTYDGFNKTVANSAISTANAIKAGGTTVYSIGIFSGADASTAGKEPDKDYEGSGWSANYTEAEMSAACNWFMQKVSSNNGTPRTPSYYLSAADADSLNSIFQQISDQIETGGSSSTLTADAVVKDIISPQFELPANATTESIKLYTAESNGSVNSWKTRETFTGSVSLGTNDNSVSVSGFSFKDNWCGNETINGQETFHNGKKLIIEFTVQPKAGFLGGNNVYTNGSAGIYENGSAQTPVMTFNQPQVNVPIDAVTVNAADKNVYLLGGLTDDELKSGATVTVGEGTKAVSLDLSKANENYGLADWQTAYVDITVKLYGADGTTEITDLTNLKDDTTYTVSVTVAPKNEALGTSSGTPATAKTGANNPAANIYVFKPELTFKDSTAYYGESVPANNNYSGNKVGSETWKHGDTVSTDVTMLGTKPTLDISYTPDESKLESGKYTKQDVPVAATVKIGTENVNEHTTFVHQDCTGKTCALPEGYHFWIHIQTCMLNITKQGGADDESYVFDVFKDGVKYSEVTVWGNDTETLFELPIGTYTIDENTGWSWRFSANNGGSAELTAQNPTGSIACTNTKNNHQWLNGFSQVVRNIFVSSN